MHVLKQTAKSFDYLVGARLEGFKQTVNITNAPLIVCEGDEYPASVIDKRPKFHFLFPHIAIITGIAWDHINVFPTFEIYLNQFKIFIDKIQTNGLLIYNETDFVLKQLVESNDRKDIRYQPYQLPQHIITNGKTIVTIEGLQDELHVFGNHNLLNLNAAYYACKELGISANEFLKAISTFTGASKRLEILASNNTTIVYRDFAHAPSKVKATIEAVKQQFPDRVLIAILELHTYSSLSEQFLTEYKGAMNKADVAVVFYSKHALKLKRMPQLPEQKVLNGFAKDGLIVMNTKDELHNFLIKQNYINTNLLLMSSGNFDELDITAVTKIIIK